MVISQSTGQLMVRTRRAIMLGYHPLPMGLKNMIMSRKLLHLNRANSKITISLIKTRTLLKVEMLTLVMQ